MANAIISIDWDHTFRKLDGLDINLLMLALYANANHITVGLTTHRDIENTTLYTLYPALENTGTTNDDALAATISYWHDAIFSQMQLKFDFINARYQPLYDVKNYYETTLLPLERQLANDILSQNLLANREQVQLKITEYLTLKEPAMQNNDYKEMQIAWLCNRYSQQMNAPIFHLDDDERVAQTLSAPDEHSKIKCPIKTIYVDDESLIGNQHFLALLEHIGLVEYGNQLINLDNISANHELLTNPRAVLSAGLLLAQASYDDAEIIAKVKDIFDIIKPNLTASDQTCHMIINDILVAVEEQQQPVRLIANNLLSLLF